MIFQINILYKLYNGLIVKPENNVGLNSCKLVTISSEISSSQFINSYEFDEGMKFIFLE